MTVATLNPISCEEVVRAVWDYLDGEIDIGSEGTDPRASRDLRSLSRPIQLRGRIPSDGVACTR